MIDKMDSVEIRAQDEVERVRDGLASVSINSLPPEVLAPIFRLIMAQQTCSVWFSEHHDSNSPIYIPKYPDAFAHVCSRWRQVALASQGLWSHIDIVLSSPLTKGFCSRAKTYAARAHQAPLDIHFIDLGYIRPLKQKVSTLMFDDNRLAVSKRMVYAKNPDEFTFLSASPKPRIQSLRLCVYQRYYPIHGQALGYCIANCSPSAAYHGLTELRLLLRETDIPSSELVSVLSSTPALRILCCDFAIDNSDSLGNSIPHIALSELEQLDIRGMPPRDIKRFLWWLSAGLKPLQLSLCEEPTLQLLGDFFERSNVDQMRIEMKGSCYGYSELSISRFYIPPQLRVLAITTGGWLKSYKSGGSHLPSNLHHRSPCPIQLDTLYMAHCYFEEFRQFEEVVAKYSPQRLVLSSCAIGTGPYLASKIDIDLLESILGTSLSEFCPSIKCLTERDPSPLDEWD